MVSQRPFLATLPSRITFTFLVFHLLHKHLPFFLWQGFKLLLLAGTKAAMSVKSSSLQSFKAPCACFPLLMGQMTYCIVTSLKHLKNFIRVLRFTMLLKHRFVF